MFTEQYRERVQDYVLGLAAADERVTASAVVGSLALSEGDRWSDLDLTFAVSERFKVVDVLADWTRKLMQEFDAIQLFDLVTGPSTYRVFLLPGCLQFDLSFTSASQFGASGPKFRLLSGTAIKKPHIQPTPAEELFGYAVHHAVRARICIERGRFWQAEYWISAARDYALSLACRRRNLSPFHGRGFDDLPSEVRERFAGGLVGSLQRDALLVALRVIVEGLLQEARDLMEQAGKVEARLREILES